MLIGLVGSSGLPVVAEGQGVYEAVELKKREEQLITSSNAFEELTDRRGYVYRDPEMNELFLRIGQQLAPPSTDPYLEYRFHIFRSPHPNAFALPDGQIYINTGMLAILENEAQLATLVAHEINHSAGHHTIQYYRSTRSKLIAGTVAGSLVGAVLGDYADLGHLLTSYAVVRAILGYSRDLEEEADRRGVQKVAEIGYDVREAPRLFEILHDDPEGERVEIKTKWSTHPQLLERAAYLRQMASDIGKKTNLDELRVGAESYRELRWGVALDTVYDYIDSDYPRSALKLAKRLVGERSASAEAHIALAEACRALGARAETPPPTLVTKKEKKQRARERARLTRVEREAQRQQTSMGTKRLQQNLASAQQAYQQALEIDPDHAEAHRGLGLTLLGLGNDREAAKELVIYLRSRPDAPDREVILDHVREITKRLKQEEESDANNEQ